MKITKQPFAAAALLFAALLSNVANAAIEDSFKNMFQQHINVTSPASGDVDMMGMGFLSGGSIEVRNQVSAPAVIKFDAPRAKAGCNGWSIYGGSISFIKLDQFVEYARDILTNSAGYLFDIALKAICSSCSATMQMLRQGVDNINNQFKDSCTMAREGVDMLSEQLTQMAGGEMGAFSNPLDASVSMVNDKLSAIGLFQKKAVEEDDPIAKEVMEITTTNILFGALNANESILDIYPELLSKNTVDFVVFREAVEEIQSITGTLLRRPIDQKPSGNADPTPSSDEATIALEYRDPTIEIDQLFKGEKTVGEETAQTVSIMTCQKTKDDDPFCSHAEPVDSPAGRMVGMLSHFEKMIVGETGVGGILGKIRIRAELSDQEQNFLRTTDIPVMAMLNNVASAGALGEKIGRHMARIIAADRFIAFVNSLTSTIQTQVVNHNSINANNSPGYAKFEQRLQKINEEVYKWSIQQSESLEADSDLTALYNNLLKFTHGRRSLGTQ